MEISDSKSNLESLLKSSLKLFILTAVLAILWLGKPVLVPIAAGLLLAFILLPVVRFLEKKSVPKFLAISMTIFTLIGIVALAIYLYGNQIVQIVDEFGSFQSRLVDTINSIVNFINKRLDLDNGLKTPDVISRAKTMVDDNQLMTQVVGSAFSSIGSVFLFIVFAILFLVYRHGLLEAFTHFWQEEEDQKAVRNAVKEASTVGRNYVLGILVLIIVLTILNTIGFLIVGLDYPLFFGFLPAVFCIIPYIGSYIGAIVVFLFAVFNYDTYHYPLGVLIVVQTSQVLESNVLNPKIVGGNLNLSVLFVIIFLMLGQLIWGVPGLILAVPMMAMVKVFCEKFESLKPISLLIGNEVHSDKGTKPGSLFRAIKRYFSKSDD